MARMAAADGIHTIVVTPHQLGAFAENRRRTVRAATAELQLFLNRARSSARGVARRRRADRSRHDLEAARRRGVRPWPTAAGTSCWNCHTKCTCRWIICWPNCRPRLVGILSHPERNLGILAEPRMVGALVEPGCLMQLTAGSLLGAFGPQVQRFSEQLADRGARPFREHRRPRPQESATAAAPGIRPRGRTRRSTRWPWNLLPQSGRRGAGPAVVAGRRQAEPAASGRLVTLEESRLMNSVYDSSPRPALALRFAATSAPCKAVSWLRVDF